MQSKKSILSLLILLVFSIYGKSQKNEIWLNNSLKPCKKGKATMYMHIHPVNKAYELHIFNKADIKVMTGHSIDPKGELWHGPFKFYHPNGQIESEGLYQEGSKVGIWNRFDVSGKSLAERMYAAFDHKTMAYFYVDQMPFYEAGEKEFEEILKLSLRDLVNESVFLEKESTLELSFVVTEKGAIENLKLTRGISAEWDAKALNLLAVLPDWIPGKNQGEDVRVRVSRHIELGER